MSLNMSRMNSMLASIVVLAATMTGCVRPVERFISKDESTNRVLEYRHEIADDDSLEEIWITAAGKARRVYGPIRLVMRTWHGCFGAPTLFMYCVARQVGRLSLWVGIRVLLHP
jgi:hypothetical protein